MQIRENHALVTNLQDKWRSFSEIKNQDLQAKLFHEFKKRVALILPLLIT